MKSYKVKGLIFYSNLTLNSRHILNDSQAEVQTKLDEYSQQGYWLMSTNTVSYGPAVYICLYSEKDLN
ncbi:hypothetical protein GGR92_003627 [Spirosoma lacussanchae]